ncbi:MAG: hypothetical protein CMK59_13750 [Proteobacteria bacterium]|nr:hypothetical protein [Pseudomonadota bacterium]
MRTLLFMGAMLFSFDAFACPMADAAAYKADMEAVKKSEGAKATFKLDGMSCGDCSDKVKAALKGLEGVILTAVDYQTGAVEIAYDEKKVDVAKIENALTSTGYKITDKPS